jgi:hypothetical protein
MNQHPSVEIINRYLDLKLGLGGRKYYWDFLGYLFTDQEEEYYFYDFYLRLKRLSDSEMKSIVTLILLGK